MEFGPGPARLKLGIDSDIKVAVSMASYAFPCFYCASSPTPQNKLQELRIKNNWFSYIVTCNKASCLHTAIADVSKVEILIAN